MRLFSCQRRSCMRPREDFVRQLRAHHQAEYGQIPCGNIRCVKTYVGDLFHVFDHFIIALGLLAQPREEGLAGELLEHIREGHQEESVPFALWRRHVSKRVLSGSGKDRGMWVNQSHGTKLRSRLTSEDMLRGSVESSWRGVDRSQQDRQMRVQRPKVQQSVVAV